ncbi:MAG: LysM peptidoglycan-binding domain-containing protein, partial [Spirochaetia bacterium]
TIGSRAEHRLRILPMACRVARTLCMSFLLVGTFTLSALESSYTVKEGETLTSVARRVEVPVDVLTLFNGISDPGKLRAGTVLRVPPVHAVRKGETLYGIARDYSVPLAKLLELNKLPANARIKAGLRLFIPMEVVTAGAPQVAEQSAEKAGPSRTTVQATLPARPVADLVWPHPGRHEQVKGKISGLVFYGARGDPVHSATAGEVKWVAPYWGLGKVVLIKSQDGSIFSYWGNEEILVNVGDRVNPGTEIARIGDSPQGGGAKLYFSIKDAKGQIVDPEKYFSEKSQA